MGEKLQGLPAALQRQILLRLGIGVVSFLLFFVILFLSWDIYLCIPCLILSAFLIVNGGSLFYNCIKGTYVVVQGVCSEIETKGIYKKVKAIYIAADGKQLKIPVRQRIKKLRAGDTVTVYMSNRTPIYEDGNVFTVCSYHALDIRKEV